MSKITLRQCQREAIEKALSVRNSLFCMRVGGGKTFASMFLSRILLNNKKIDKVIYCVTSSGVGVFKNEFKNVGIDIKLIDNVEDLIKFFDSKDKFILIKHSFMENIGIDKTIEDAVEDYLSINYKKLLLIVDEAHKFSNHESNGNFAIDNTRRFYEKIVIMTATPYSSKLDQVFGLIKLIYPNKWKDLKDFRNNYVKTEIVKDWKTGVFLRTEDVEYINLPNLRKNLEEFTYFYFPPIPLEYKEHKAKLSPEKFNEYRKMCQEIYAELKDRVNPDKKKKKKEEE